MWLKNEIHALQMFFFMHVCSPLRFIIPIKVALLTGQPLILRTEMGN